MWKIKKRETANELVEQPITEVEKKPFAFLKKKEISAVDLVQHKVREHDGLFFKHKVTGKEFNSFVIETQNAIIQMKQEMLSFTGRVDGIGSDLDRVDKRHNEISETTIQVLTQKIDDMQLKNAQREEENRKSLRIYQIIAAVAVLMSIASFVLFFVR